MPEVGGGGSYIAVSGRRAATSESQHETCSTFPLSTDPIHMMPQLPGEAEVALSVQT